LANENRQLKGTAASTARYENYEIFAKASEVPGWLWQVRYRDGTCMLCGRATHLGNCAKSEKERGYVEELVRIANRRGYLLEHRVSDRHRVMRHKDTGEELEIELLEIS
jgi:predicted metal-binding protein